MTIFRETYFYIEAGYVWGEGHTPEQSEKFNAEIKRIFETELTGWKLLNPDRSAGTCAEYGYKDGISKLYCHPMNLSGIINTELKMYVEMALRKSEVIELRYTKEFKEYENITLEEVKKRIQDRKFEIVKDLFNVFQTRQRKFYHYIGNCDRIADKYHVDAINQKWNHAEYDIIRDVLKYAVEIGVIKQAKDERDVNIYRSLNKTEFKAWQKKNPALMQIIGV